MKTAPDDLKRAYVEKVAGSEAFSRAPQLQRLFRWLALKSILGEAPPTEYEVARGALGKPESFDPQADSLVRKEMSRLRAKLRDYYVKEGAGDTVEIRCQAPYLLAFELRRGRRHVAAQSVDGDAGLLILPVHAENDLRELADTLHMELQARLAGLGGLPVVAPTTARQFAGRSGDIREFAAETGARFVLEGAARRKERALIVTLWLVDGHTGKTRLPFRMIGLDVDELAAGAAQWVLQCLAEPEGRASASF